MASTGSLEPIRIHDEGANQAGLVGGGYGSLEAAAAVVSSANPTPTPGAAEKRNARLNRYNTKRSSSSLQQQQQQQRVTFDTLKEQLLKAGCASTSAPPPAGTSAQVSALPQPQLNEPVLTSEGSGSSDMSSEEAELIEVHEAEPGDEEKEEEVGGLPSVDPEKARAARLASAEAMLARLRPLVLPASALALEVSYSSASNPSGGSSSPFLLSSSSAGRPSSPLLSPFVAGPNTPQSPPPTMLLLPPANAGSAAAASSSSSAGGPSVKPIGRGAYSLVFRSGMGPSAKPVAVKVLLLRPYRELGKEMRKKSKRKQKKSTSRNGRNHDKQLQRQSAGAVWTRSRYLALKSLAEEATLQASVCHPNVLRVMGVVVKPVLALVTEHCGRGSIADLLLVKNRPNNTTTATTSTRSTTTSGRYIREDPRMTWQLLAQMAVEAASALCHLHSIGVAHNDVSARNLLVSEEGSEVKLADFGLACRLDEPAGHRHGDGEEEYGATSGGMLAGPLRWMAPEAVTAGRQQTPPAATSSSLDRRKCDVFSFGMTLFEMVTGLEPWETLQAPPLPEVASPPVDGDRRKKKKDDEAGRRDLEAFMRVQRGERPEIVAAPLNPAIGPSGTVPSIPPDLAALIEWCWCHEPEERPSMEEVVAYLREWQERYCSAALPPAAAQAQAQAQTEEVTVVPLHHPLSWTGDWDDEASVLSVVAGGANGNSATNAAAPPAKPAVDSLAAPTAVQAPAPPPAQPTLLDALLGTSVATATISMTTTATISTTATVAVSASSASTSTYTRFSRVFTATATTTTAAIAGSSVGDMAPAGTSTPVAALAMPPAAPHAVLGMSPSLNPLNPVSNPQDPQDSGNIPLAAPAVALSTTTTTTVPPALASPPTRPGRLQSAGPSNNTEAEEEEAGPGLPALSRQPSVGGSSSGHNSRAQHHSHHRRRHPSSSVSDTSGSNISRQRSAFEPDSAFHRDNKAGSGDDNDSNDVDDDDDNGSQDPRPANTATSSFGRLPAPARNPSPAAAAASAATPAAAPEAPSSLLSMFLGGLSTLGKAAVMASSLLVSGPTGATTQVDHEDDNGPAPQTGARRSGRLSDNNRRSRSRSRRSAGSNRSGTKNRRASNPADRDSEDDQEEREKEILRAKVRSARRQAAELLLQEEKERRTSNVDVAAAEAADVLVTTLSSFASSVVTASSPVLGGWASSAASSSESKASEQEELPTVLPPPPSNRASMMALRASSTRGGSAAAAQFLRNRALLLRPKPSFSAAFIGLRTDSSSSTNSAYNYSNAAPVDFVAAAASHANGSADAPPPALRRQLPPATSSSPAAAVSARRSGSLFMPNGSPTPDLHRPSVSSASIPHHRLSSLSSGSLFDQWFNDNDGADPAESSSSARHTPQKSKQPQPRKQRLPSWNDDEEGANDGDDEGAEDSVYSPSDSDRDDDDNDEGDGVKEAEEAAYANESFYSIKAGAGVSLGAGKDDLNVAPMLPIATGGLGRWAGSPSRLPAGLPASTTSPHAAAKTDIATSSPGPKAPLPLPAASASTSVHVKAAEAAQKPAPAPAASTAEELLEDLLG